jgi:hypothetical protein
MEIEDDFSEALMQMIGVGLIMSVLLAVFAVKSGRSLPTLAEVVLVLAVCTPFLGFFVWRAIRLGKERSNHLLGFNGERAVGEELNKLMLDGCHVFHDFPADPKWNIDHVVVAPSGVYSIETKTRRKEKAPQGKREHEIVFDGVTLHFPHGSDRHGLDQAKANARWLGQFLSAAIGERVSVRPILTFPGWWIESRVHGDNIKVLNPKQIRAVIHADGPPALTAQQIKRIVHQLDQKCRDVEF